MKLYPSGLAPDRRLGSRLVRILAISLIALLCAGSPALFAKPKAKDKGKPKPKKLINLPPRMKIFDVDASKAPMIKIYATFLNSEDKVVPAKMLKKLQVVLLTGKTGSQKKVLREFKQGRVKKGQRGSLKTFSKVKGKLGVVVIAAGHGGDDLKNGPLAAMQKQGLELFFKKLGKQDKVQFIWYNNKLRLYSSARKKELVEYTALRCGKYRKKKKDKKAKKPDTKPGTSIVPESVCAPTTEFQGFKKTLKKLKYEGQNPKLVDAIDLAFTLLVQTPELPRQKVIIILSDGLIGNLAKFEQLKSALAEAQRFGTSSRRKKKRRRKRRRRRRGKRTKRLNRADFKKAAKSFQQQIKKVLVARHRLFKSHFVKWIPLAKAENIRVFVVGYPTSTHQDLYPLKVLAYKTGGSYRFAPDVETLEAVYESVVKELTDSYVISFNSKLDAKKHYRLMLQANVLDAPYSTPKYSFYMPELPGGFKHWVKGKWLWLQSKVGYVLALIIVIAVALLITILLLLLIKKIFGFIWKKTGKKLVDKAKKDAAKAGKAAAKGGK